MREVRFGRICLVPLEAGSVTKIADAAPLLACKTGAFGDCPVSVGRSLGTLFPL